MFGYGIKTADGTGLFQVVLDFLPSGVNPNRVWPLDTGVPSGTTRVGWQLVTGTVEPFLLVYDPKPNYDTGTQQISPGPIINEVTGERQTWLVQSLNVPDQVSNYAFRAALILSGFAPGSVDNFISTGIQGLMAKGLVSNKWQNSTTIKRTWNFLNTIEGIYGINDANVDKMFILASKIDSQ